MIFGIIVALIVIATLAIIFASRWLDRRCPYCGRIFPNRSQMDWHLQRKHHGP